jgi:putative lipoic acid-binding regulatory protein
LSDNEETLLEFPCEFSIKTMGKTDPHFENEVIEIVLKHVPDLYEGAVKSRPSKGGKWVSVTITITATSKAQLDAIYMDLSSFDKVVMSL